MAEAFSLCLPPLSEDDPLFFKKKSLLDSRGLSYEFEVRVSASAEELLQTLDRFVRVSRILNLNEIELYFVEDSTFGPFSPGNELQALSLVLSTINSSLSVSEVRKPNVFKVFQESIVGMINNIKPNTDDMLTIEGYRSIAEEALLEWGVSHGIKKKLNIAYFGGAGRGLVASEDVGIGDFALDIPESLIISDDVLDGNEMKNILKEYIGLTAETMLLLWSMNERYNMASNFKKYFDTLPAEFNTGLSFGIDALSVLEGTLLFDEISQAKEHLRKQYEALCPIFTNHPEVFQPELYTWEHFVWACELWYSNSMKIVFSDGKLRTCLVPIAGLLNHSLCPHILNYGRVDPVSKSLKFKVSRPCKKGEQCYLSYGNHSSSHLITFYGFMPKGESSYDVIPLDFDAPDGDISQFTSEERDWATHMVRGTWLSKHHMPPSFGFPPPLICHLCSVLTDDDAGLPAEDPKQFHTSRNHEILVLETIDSIFTSMMESLGEPEEHESESARWDVKLALEYKDLQRRIIASILSSCSRGLDILGCSLSSTP